MLQMVLYGNFAIAWGTTSKRIGVAELCGMPPSL
jgi:hypothetical protein